MPNIKSAERRMRSSARRRQQNQTVKSRLHTLEKKFKTLADEGKKPEAAEALKAIVSAFDKAAKSGVVHQGTADRKKSRLANQLNRTAKAKAAA
jgi:small subunit ribosomal protein S20